MSAKKTVKKPVKKVTTNKTKVSNHSVANVRHRKLTRKELKRRAAESLKKEQKTKHLPTSWSILTQSLRHLYAYNKTFLGILLIYAFFYILFVKGISANFQLGTLRANLTSSFDHKISAFHTGIALYGLLLGSAGTSSSESSGVYQTVLLIIISLALIWALRTSYGKVVKLAIRDAFYKSTSSLVPFLAIVFIIVLQCLPAVFLGTIFSTIQSSHLTVNAFQQGVAIAILAAGFFWTFYMLSSSLFALYIVTLPNAKPWEALKAAKRLVRFRRVIVLRKVLFLPLILLIFAGVMLVPLILIYAKAAEIMFLVFTILVLGVIHGYLYTLYRYLINDTQND